MKKLTLLLATVVLGIANVSHAEDAVETQSTYPLTTCIVSGEALDSMGKPYVLNYEGEEVQLCCKMCRKEFEKSPEEFMTKLEAAKATAATGGEASQE